MPATTGLSRSTITCTANGYLRVRVGIGKPPDASRADYVLKRPGSAERTVLEVAERWPPTRWSPS